jgi:dTDP-4-dehydrorhamnose 3,5-epimerase
VKWIPTSLPGALIIEPRVLSDARGFFYESFNQETFRKEGIEVSFTQSNISRSARGVLRGLHYQWPNPQGKLVSVLEGEAYDVAVDVRRDSPTFGQWTGAMLTAENRRQLWIPEGYAHGFCVLSEFATLSYQCTALYDRNADAGIRWNDDRLKIDWPINNPLLSEKDAAAPSLADIPDARLPTCTP